MAKWLPILLGVMLMTGVRDGECRAARADLVVAGHLTVLTLHGTHYEAGLAHGRALREPIRELVGLWKRDTQERFGIDADEFLSRFMNQGDFLPAIRKWCPGLLEEVRGIADGAGIPFATMLAYQLVDEAWVMGGSLSGEKCTTIGLGRSAGHPCCIAQNLDIPRFYHGHQLLLCLRDTESGLEQDVLTFPGYIGACGLNSKSVGVGANALSDLRYTPNGLPVSFIVRSLLECRTGAAAVAFLRAIRHVAPQNYVVGDGRDVGSYECSDTTVEQFRPLPQARVTFHANRPIANRNYTDSALAGLRAVGLDPTSYPENCTRLQFLRHTFGGGAGKWDAARLMHVLRDRESGVNNATTYASVIMVLGNRPELHVAAGRPDDEPFRVFRCDGN